MGKRGVEVRKQSVRIGFMYRGEYCRETLRIAPTPRNLKYAERKRTEIVNQIERGTFDYAATFPNSSRLAKFHRGHAVKLRDYLDTWLDRIRPTVSASTYRDYKNTVLNRLIPALGHYTVAGLTRPVIRDFATGISATNKRIANILSPLRQALDDAVDDDLIQTNPLAGWRYRRRESPHSQDEIDPFTQAEQEAILGTLESQGRNLVQFAFWAGLRTSELVALEWSDIDWIRGVVSITRAMTQASDKAELPKTAAGRREVSLLSPALEALQAQKAHTFLTGGRIFLNPRTNAPWTGDQAIRRTLWTPALKRAGVRYRYPYQTRHTYASMMLSAGENPLWVAAQMGHRDWSMIARRYGKWLRKTDNQAGSKAVESFGKTTPSLPTASKRHEP